MFDNAISVKQLNLYVRSLLEGDVRLANVTVLGEISNFKNHYSSGHWYFTLKDNDASIRCVMFKTNAMRVGFDVSDGLQVILKGRVSLYEKDGQYQFYAEEMMAAGLGDITLKFEQTKEKLEKEGLFDPTSKRPIPPFPKRIAVVTSPTGAAIRDILNILSRRWPIADVVICPVSVQGELAVPEMLSTLKRLYKLNDIDLIIIGRGGGSIEDLWEFNDENLARCIFESPFPVISAVGHETDFTICDFVADLRAPTPSAAAELAVPDIMQIKAKIDKHALYLKNQLTSSYKLSHAKLSALTTSPYLKNPLEMLVDKKHELLDRTVEKLNNQTNELCKFKENYFLNFVARLDNLSPLKTLTRGFATVSKEDRVIKSVNDIKKEDIINIKFIDGEADCVVKNTRGV